MKRTVTTAFFLLACTACGPTPIDRTFHGELTESDPRVPHDGSHYDEYAFEADPGWVISIEMRSDELDTYLWLVVPERYWPLEDDDGLGEGTNSAIWTIAPRRGTYRVLANSFDATGRGSYTLTIHAAPPNDAGR